MKKARVDCSTHALVKLLSFPSFFSSPLVADLGGANCKLWGPQLQSMEYGLQTLGVPTLLTHRSRSYDLTAGSYGAAGCTEVTTIFSDHGVIAAFATQFALRW